MYIINDKSAPKRRAEEQKKQLNSNMVDAQDVIATLMEQNAALSEENTQLTEKLTSLQSDISDAQEIIAGIIEGN